MAVHAKWIFIRSNVACSSRYIKAVIYASWPFIREDILKWTTLYNCYLINSSKQNCQNILNTPF